MEIQILFIWDISIVLSQAPKIHVTETCSSLERVLFRFQSLYYIFDIFAPEEIQRFKDQLEFDSKFYLSTCLEQYQKDIWDSYLKKVSISG